MNAPLSGPEDTRFYPVRIVAQTGSTNSDVLAAARRGAREGFTLQAGQQTRGRGRSGRLWFSEPGDSVLLSVLLRPPVADVSLVPMLSGLAVQEALQNLLPEVDPSAFGLKWPNDIIMLNKCDRKVAGILIESELGGDNVAVVVGVGVNVRLGNTLPEELIRLATSLEDVSGEELSSSEVVAALLQSLERWLRVLEIDGRSQIVEAYRARCCSIGREVSYRDAEGALRQGRAVGIDDSGAVLVDTQNGTEGVLSGDLTHLGFPR